MKSNETLERTLAGEGWLTVAAATELLAGLRRRTLYAWVKAGQVASRRVGRRLFVWRADVQRALGLKEAG
jgi:excisionase family DNA binding protein